MPSLLPGGLVVFRTAEWGALPPREAFAETEPRAMILHHMATANRGPLVEPECAVSRAMRLARDCQRYHMEERGFADSGQHFTISIDGIVCEGRTGAVDALLARRCIRGAHAYDADTGANANVSWGTEHEGLYTEADVPGAQWKASVRLHAAIALLCDLEPRTIAGHRDTGCTTQCPGDRFHARIPEFRAAVRRELLQLRASG
ncbi:MAG TPA: peptidoglycan recognition family protein [Candidatus Elarobacter sp.]|jgi:hypothetical protein